MPSHGRFVSASSAPMHEWRKRPGERTGLNWRIPSQAGRRFVRHALYDTNYWKSFVHDRLRALKGDPGSLDLFGGRNTDHRLFGDHLTAEYAVVVEARGRKVDEWKLRPSRPDNHWLDGVVGCAVAASIEGVHLPNMNPSEVGRNGRVRLRLSDLQSRKRGF